MYSEDDLETAIEAGIVDRATVERLRDFFARSQRTMLVDEEHFRLITGFNDIFVSIASILLLVALGWLGQAIPLGPATNTPHPLAGLLVAAVAWRLAVIFTARRRMALPSILLLFAFVGGIFIAVAATGFAVVGSTNLPSVGSTSVALILAVAALAAAAGAYGHWRRFHVPITVAAGAAALVGVALSLLATMPVARKHLALAAFIGGLCVFALAMRWDMTDPKRETRRADIAFWLHLLAAPLIIHPVFAMMGLFNGGVGLAGAAMVVILYVVLGLIALLIDRRALMVSALAYVLYALSMLLQEFGALSLSVALTALVLGSALLLLSAYWTSVRVSILSALPPSLSKRLPAATGHGAIAVHG